MSNNERHKLKVLHQLVTEDIRCIDAAEILQLSERQVYRLLRRYRSEGDQGVIHRLRGHPSNRGYPRQLHDQVVALYRERYQGYGPTLFTEKLDEDCGISIDPETTRQWLIKTSLWNGARAPRRHRKRRARRTAIGELIQFDGSEHLWFEDRAPACTLLGAIDDASNQLFVRFAQSENTRDVFRTLWDYVTEYGIPRCLYTDRGSVYYAEHKLTDVARALRVLGTDIIYARSPQAKGRIERSNRTQQDRLIKAMRQENISTITDANHFLDTYYLAKHNQRFAHTDGLLDVHRPVDGFDLKNIFCFETQRTVYNDYTIRLDSQIIQLHPSRTPLPPPRYIVTLRRWLDDSLHIFWKERELRFTFVEEQQRITVRSIPIPSENHPWKHKPPIGKAKRMTIAQLCRKR